MQKHLEIALHGPWPEVTETSIIPTMKTIQKKARGPQLTST